ncbi:MAG: site-specific DNA-methyltransferase [Brevibacterium aurantiacum]|uniref:site-specific DNA-methyltransferase n=1 Tax=Brevibacterium aurantiacum TaxID=273384 RepID=UPI003F8EB79E
MSKLTDLLNQVRKTDPRLGQALAEELRDLANRRTFGLVFEQHQPENVELPGVDPQRGDKVHILPPRGETTPTDPTLWQVLKTKHFPSPKTLLLEELRLADDTNHASAETREVPLDDVVVVAETGDTIYPGLIQTGEVLNGPDDAPAHVVINAENSHALRMLTYTHAHSVDVIYIDPPYNTGAKDWKYNNDYVGSEDDYRHSKWLSFMQRRLEMSKQLLNPDDSVLIVTIDEKEYLRLGLLLEQVFPNANIQMVTSVINPMGSRRAGEFSRVDEYLFFVMLGSARVADSDSTMLERKSDSKNRAVRWTPLNRDGSGWERAARPNMFYPLFVDPLNRKVIDVGSPVPPEVDRSEVPSRDDLIAIWPMKGDREARWQVGPDTCRKLIEDGYLTIGSIDSIRGTATVRYLTSGAQRKIRDGTYMIAGLRPDGSKIVESNGANKERPRSVWHQPSHSARDHGSSVISCLIPGRRFPFPKSLYAVEDALRFFVAHKPNALVVDFFSGSGTTAHAVMRLNKQDGGQRRSISITNNEVSADEQTTLRKQGRRPGDVEWESVGICDYVTKPRVTAAITGKTPDGTPVKGAYKFTDEFDMADGFAANARFFTLTYESAALISQRLAFERVAPLLWLRAGQTGRVIGDLGDTGWDIADTYAVIENTDDLEAFLGALALAVNGSESLKTVFVITDDDRQFQAAARRLDDLGVDSHRLYASYLTNFEFTNGDAQ